MVKRMRFDRKLALHHSNNMKDAATRSRIGGVGLVALAMLCFGPGAANAQGAAKGQGQGQAVAQGAASAQPCTETVYAKVVALDQAFYVNRFGALQAGGMVFALERDVVSMDGSVELKPGKVMVRAEKRPRPLTLRVNKGQCLEIQFQNLLSPKPVTQKMDLIPGRPP